MQTGLRPGQVGIALTGQPPAGQELGQRHLGGDGADVPEDEGSVRVVGPGQAGRVDGSRRAAGTGVVAIGHDVQRGGRTRVQLRVPCPDRLVDEPDLGGRTDQAALPGGRPAARPMQPVAGEDVQQPGIPVVQDVGDGCVLVQPPGGRERDVRVRGGQHQVDRVVRVTVLAAAFRAGRQGPYPLSGNRTRSARARTRRQVTGAHTRTQEYRRRSVSRPARGTGPGRRGPAGRSAPPGCRRRRCSGRRPPGAP